MLTRAEIPGLIATCVLLALGIGLAVGHWRSWKHDRSDPELASRSRWSQFRRHAQVALLIVVEGLLLCGGDTVLPILERTNRITQKQMAGWWTIDVLLMLAIAVWIALLALGDMAVTVSGTRRELRTMREKERELHQELERFRSRQREP